VRQQTSAPTKALIAVDEMLFIGAFLPRLPEKVVKLLQRTPIGGNPPVEVH